MTIEAPPAAPAPAAAPAATTTPAPAAPAAAPAAPAPAADPAKPAADPAKPAASTEPRKTILGAEPAKPGDAPKDPATKPEGAPEKYTDFTLPEGLVLDAKMAETFKATAKELGLSQASAQKLVDLQAQSVKAEIEGRLVAFNNQVEAWDKESRALYGANADKQFGIAAKAMEQIGTPELRTLLNDAGLGSHPEVVKFFVKAGSMLSEDQPVDGKRAGGDAKSTASLLYPTMDKK